MKLAREINNSMPFHTVDLVVNALNEAGKSVKGSKIGILGLAYKGGIEDLRKALLWKLWKSLKKKCQSSYT